MALIRYKKLVLTIAGAAAAIANEETFQQVVRPLLERRCAGCHNEKVQSGKLNLRAFPTHQAASANPEVWGMLLEKVESGKMPPPGQATLRQEEVSALRQWVKSLPSQAAREQDPGRITARRLNRVEYNNTVRDLLGVDTRPAEEFPVDDSGYGFDNNGDVLSISPMLMEKYMQAAARLSRLAVYGERYSTKPTVLARLLNRRSPDANDVLSKGSYLPYSLRGAMYGQWTFPVDAEYEFRVRIANFREAQDAGATPGRRRLSAIPRSLTDEERKVFEEQTREAAPPRKLVLTLDGKPVMTEVVEGSGAFGYSRGEFTARVPVKAGERAFRASYPELADLIDPRQNINRDMRRGLFVDYMEIVGPYDPSANPPASYRKIFTCGHPPGKHESACARRSVEALMERAYRRPATPDEVSRKMRLVEMAAADGETVEEGVRLALEAVLVSPQFLFRVEKDSGAAGARRVNDLELASRLSYFLWASMPDEELLRTAKENRLHLPDVLNKQVRRMMADAKARNLVDNFAAQWLQLRSLGRTKPDPVRFPTVDDELLDAMRQETSLFVEAMIREDRSILDFIDAPFTFLNGPLARHYGMQGVSGEEFRRIALDGTQRSGLLTQGAILTVSSYPTRTSPPVRGKWVLENLLGAAPPPPPPDAPVLNESELSGVRSMRERMEQHRKDPSCAPCHVLMDPIGFGLEGYDAAGAWRTHDGSVAIDTSGTLPDGKSFRGAEDLKKILRGQSGAFTRNLTEKLMTFALGRGLERQDGAVVEEIARQAAAQGHRFSVLVTGIVNSKPFQMRSSEGATQ